MAVIINEFEVVSEPAPAKAPDAARPETPRQAPTPYDVENTLRRRRDRCERLRAH